MAIKYYSSPIEYMRSCADIRDQIAAADAIIAALYLAAVAAAEGENLIQYSLNDGQTIISTTPRSSRQIAESITAWEGIRNRLVKKITGTGIVRLVDGKNLTGRHGC